MLSRNFMISLTLIFVDYFLSSEDFFYFSKKFKNDKYNR